jgi:ABC-2 type transport system ATP-binding protein
MVAQGVTVFVTTAYMDEAERCDHVALLDRGEVIALDEPEALQRSMEGEMVSVRTPDVRAALAVLERTTEVRRAAPFGDTIHVRILSRERDWPVVERALAAANVPLTSVEHVEPSLEDVFIERVTAAEKAA